MFTVFVDEMWFDVRISAPREDPPMGFLFLCPAAKDFQLGPLSFWWPDCPAYWSLDQRGIKRLSIEKATALGFPPLQFNTTIWGRSWDASVYAGLRQFHRAKGFDPESQDVARHLGRRLYELSSEMDALFAHGKSTTARSKSSSSTNEYPKWTTRYQSRGPSNS
jgi:hypothetical protein